MDNIMMGRKNIPSLFSNVQLLYRGYFFLTNSME